MRPLALLAIDFGSTQPWSVNRTVSSPVTSAAYFTPTDPPPPSAFVPANPPSRGPPEIILCGDPRDQRNCDKYVPK